MAYSRMEKHYWTRLTTNFTFLTRREVAPILGEPPFRVVVLHVASPLISSRLLHGEPQQ